MVLTNPPQRHPRGIANPVRRFLPIFLLNPVHKVHNLKLHERIGLVRVRLEIREPPWQAPQRDYDAVVGFGGGAEGKPRAAGVHDCELPVLFVDWFLVFVEGGFFGYERTDHGLAFV